MGRNVSGRNVFWGETSYRLVFGKKSWEKCLLGRNVAGRNVSGRNVFQGETSFYQLFPMKYVLFWESTISKVKMTSPDSRLKEPCLMHLDWISRHLEENMDKNLKSLLYPANPKCYTCYEMNSFPIINYLWIIYYFAR